MGTRKQVVTDEAQARALQEAGLLWYEDDYAAYYSGPRVVDWKIPNLCSSPTDPWRYFVLLEE